MQNKQEKKGVKNVRRELWILTELDLMEICFVVIRSDENLSTID